MDPDHDADMSNSHSAKSLDHRGSGSSLNGVDHHSIPDTSVEDAVDQNATGGGNSASGSRVQDFPMLPPSTGEEMDSESAPAASEHATPLGTENFPLGVPMAEDKMIPSRRDYEAAFILIGHPKTSKKIKNYRITSPPKPSRSVKSNSCQRSPPLAKDAPGFSPPTPRSPLPESQDASPPVIPPPTPPAINLPDTKVSAENDLELIVEGFRKLKVSDSKTSFALQPSLDLSHSSSVSDDADALGCTSYDSTSGSQDQLLFESEDLIGISDIDPIHSTPVNSATYGNNDSELWEELGSLDGSFPLPQTQAGTTAFEFLGPIWTMKGVQPPPRDKLLLAKIDNLEPEPSPSADIKQLPDVLLSPLILEKDIDNTTSSAGVLFGKKFEFPSTHWSPLPSRIKGNITRDLTATKYSHKLPKHRPSARRPRSSEPLSSFIDYVPGPVFRPLAPLPSSRRAPRKHNSFEISRHAHHGSLDESFTIPTALKDESVVVRLVQDVEDVKDVQVKGVNADPEPPLLEKGVDPRNLPVVQLQEPEANALRPEVVFGASLKSGFYVRCVLDFHLRPLRS